MKRRTFIGTALALPAISVVAAATAPRNGIYVVTTVEKWTACGSGEPLQNRFTTWIHTPWSERIKEPWFDIGGNEETHIVPLRNKCTSQPQ